MAHEKLPLPMALRGMLRLSGLLTRVGVLPDHDRVAGLPASRRKAIKPARWLVGPTPEGVQHTDHEIPSRGGPLPARIYRPDGVRGPTATVMWLHGGGFMTGGRSSADHLCQHLAQSLPAVVAAIEYRLTPEFPFPAALHDCQDALLWLSANAESFGGDPGRLAVMGESAGANLTAALCLLIRDQGGPTVAFQALVYPGLDLRQQRVGTDHDVPGMGSNALARILDAYVGESDPADPLISPLLAESLAGMPTSLVITAEVDPFRDHGSAYANRLREAQVDVRHTCYVRTAHGFLDVPRLAGCSWHQAMSEIVAEASRALNTPPAIAT